MSLEDWPKPPIWPDDLPLIRDLLTDEEYAELLRRMVRVLPNGPLLDYQQACVAWSPGNNKNSQPNHRHTCQ